MKGGCSSFHCGVLQKKKSVNVGSAAILAEEEASGSYLANVQHALGEVLSSSGVSSLIFCAVLIGRGSRTCSTTLP